MSGKLTEAGWPRPIIGGLPIPWVSPPNDLAQTNAAREAACASGAICQVCGLGYQDGDPAYVVVRAKKRPKRMDKTLVWAMDNGVLHKDCLLLALARCPKLRGLRAEGLLMVVKTTGNSAKPRRNSKRHLQAVFAGSDCEIVDIGSLTKLLKG